MFYKCFSYLDIHVPRFGEFSAVVLLKWFSVPLACHSFSSGMPVTGIVHCFRVARGSCLFSPWFSTSLLFFLWDSNGPEDLSSSSAGFSSAWSDLLLRLTFFLNFSLLRIVHLVGWVLFCGSLLVTFSWWCVLGVLVLGLIHSMKSVALSYHDLWGCSPPYFFLTWSQEDCRAKIRKPVCLLYFIF